MYIMAVEFPNPPTFNQTFTSGDKTWKWTGTRWEIFVTDPTLMENYYTSEQVDQAIAGYTSLSDTPPTSAIPGSRWFKTSTGQEYMYYNNGWIEV